MIVSPGKEGIRALQSASRLFQKGIDMVDPIAATGKTFGVHLLNLNGGNDNEYKKAYARKRGGHRGGHTDLGDIANVTTHFLDAATEAIVLLRNGLTPLLPAVEPEAEEESVAPPPIERAQYDISESEDGSDLGSGTQQFGEGEIQSESGSAAASADGQSYGLAQQTASIASYPAASYPAASYPAASLPPSQMVSPERSETGTKRPRNEPTNQPTNASEKGLARRLEGELNPANQTGGYKLVRNDDIYTSLSGTLNDNTAAMDFCYYNDEYDILYLLYSFLTYLGETPWTPEVIEFLVLQIITKDLTLVELEELYKGRYKEQEPQPQEGGKPKRKTRKRKEPKLKGILKTRNKKKYEAKTRRSKRKTRK
jgi:hypothetical protein